MKININKILLYILVVISILVIAYYGIIHYVFSGWFDEIWTEENQIVIEKFYSPDSIKFIGLYKYDSGALGYTAIQMSLIKKDEKLPIGGNILQINRIPPVIKWLNKNQVYVELDTSNTPGFQIKRTFNIDSVNFMVNIK